MQSILGMRWKLRACRIQAGLTKSEAANALGVEISLLESWENGENSPSMEIGLALSELYNVPMGNMDFSRESNRKSEIEGL